MNSERNRVQVARDPSTDLRRLLAITGGRMLWAAPAVSLLVELVLLTFGKLNLAQTGRNLFAALTYSAVIGMPAMILIHWINQRVSRRLPSWGLILQAIMLIATATIGSLFAEAIFLLARMIDLAHYWASVRSSYPFIVIFTVLIGLVVASLDAVRQQLQDARLELQKKRVDKEQADRLLAQAQLSSLESRIHPHFLFNALNSIASLTHSSPRQAEETVGRLASLLRFSLKTQHTRLVPLAQELNIVRQYVEIEKTRFGDGLRCEYFVPEELLEIMTPPLALQSLVENAVKHVVSHRAEGAAIEVRATLSDRILHLETIDNGPGFELEAIQPDHGLGNLESRLKMLYGAEAGLSIEPHPGRMLVRISHPIGGSAA